PGPVAPARRRGHTSRSLGEPGSTMPTVNRFAELHDEIAGWRRDYHRHPELLYDVTRTAGDVAAKLRAFGFDEVVEGIGRSGVVGVLRGGGKGASGAIGLRADMDA